MLYKNIGTKAVRLSWVEESGQPPHVLVIDAGEVAEGPGGPYANVFRRQSRGAVVPAGSPAAIAVAGSKEVLVCSPTEPVMEAFDSLPGSEPEPAAPALPVADVDASTPSLLSDAGFGMGKRRRKRKADDSPGIVIGQEEPDGVHGDTEG